MRRSVVAALVAASVVAGMTAIHPVPARADATPAAAKGRLDDVRKALDSGRPAAAAERLAEAVAMLDELSRLDRPPAALRTMIEKAAALRDEVELDGGDVGAIVVPSPPKRPAAKGGDREGTGEAPAAKGGSRPGASAPPGRPPAAAKVAGRPGAKGKPSPGPAATVSFSRTVAPLLVRHCGGCHVSGRRGEFQFTSHATLLASGMVQRGAGADSRLVEVIRTGDMPRGGGKVPPEDVATLVAWIDEGAPCDTDPAAALANPAAPPAAAATPAGPVRLEPGDVSFAFEVAPVLVSRCGGCHDAMQPDGNLSMVSLASLLRGGRNGAPVVAGEGASSLIVRKLRGKDIDGQRMPLGKPPLADDVIDRIERWIDQGAKLDLLSAATPLDAVAAAGRARSLSHEDLRTARFEAADAVWLRSIAEEEPAVVVRDDLKVLGNVPADRLEVLADLAGEAVAGVAGVLGGRSPVVKGGVVVLAFDKPYDYSAFWENVLGDERPKGLTHHAGVTGDVVYGAMVAPAVDSPSAVADAKATLAEQVASAAFVARGAPDWFAAAAGRAVALKVAAKSTVAKASRADVTERLQRMRRPASVVEGTAAAADTAAVGGAFLAAASGGGARLGALLDKLDDGTPFEEAFAAVYHGEPRALFEGWIAKEWKRAGSPGR